MNSLSFEYDYCIIFLQHIDKSVFVLEQWFIIFLLAGALHVDKWRERIQVCHYDYKEQQVNESAMLVDIC